MDTKITPLSEKIKNKYIEGEIIYLDIDETKQALKNFCEEEENLFLEYLCGKIKWIELDNKRNEAKLKHFGEELI